MSVEGKRFDHIGQLINRVSTGHRRGVGCRRLRYCIEAGMTVRLFRPHTRTKPPQCVRVADVDGIQVDAVPGDDARQRRIEGWDAAAQLAGEPNL